MMPFGNSKVCLMRFKDLGVVIRHIAFGGLIKSVKVDSKLVHIHGNNLRLYLQVFPLSCSVEVPACFGPLQNWRSVEED